MCGLGFFIGRPGCTATGQVAATMNTIGAHRGPDGDGVFCFENFECGHTRLAIIDLSDAALQPLIVDEQFVIVFNGEVYNFIELREELQRKGHVFRTQSDTEVVCRAYIEWGSGCASKFNGMWALAILDIKARTLFVSRDHFGIKPLYYTETSSGLFFASEPKMLLPFINDKTHNKSHLESFLVSSVSEDPLSTFWSSIKSFPEASNALIDLSDPKMLPKRFFNYEQTGKWEEFSDDDIFEIFKAKFEQAVSIRLRSDVTVGSCLSGGIDSSSVVLAAAKSQTGNGKGKFRAVHGQASELQNDESYFALLAAEAAGVELVSICPQPDDFLQKLDDVIWVQDEPFGGTSIFMQYFVMEAAKAAGCKVMLDGQGGDEALLGYEKYIPAILRQKAKTYSLLKASQEFKATLANNANVDPKLLLRLHVGHSMPGLRNAASLILKHQYPWSRGISRLKVPSGSYLREVAKAHKSVFDMQVLELSKTNLPALLRFEDRNSMRHGVEARLPFLDPDLVQFSLEMPLHCKYGNGWSKLVLRRYLAEKAGEEIAFRKNKFGFNAPEETWSNSILGYMQSEIKSSKLLAEYIDFEFFKQRSESYDARSLWKLFNIARWEKQFSVI